MPASIGSDHFQPLKMLCALCFCIKNKMKFFFFNSKHKDDKNTFESFPSTERQIQSIAIIERILEFLDFFYYLFGLQVIQTQIFGS